MGPPKSPPDIVGTPLADGACVVVVAGVADCPNRPPVVVEGAAGFVPRLAPNSDPTGLDASAGGAPAGVVEPSPPNSGFAGVACAPVVPATGVVEPNEEAPAFPKRAPVVAVVVTPD